MVAFSTIKPGDVLYSVERQKMGNTTMTREAVYTVVVKEVHENHAIASWNGNAPQQWSPQRLAKLRRSKPKPKPTIFDLAREVRNSRP